MTSGMGRSQRLRGYPELLIRGRAEPRDSAARRLLQFYHLRDAPQGADEVHHDNLLLAGRHPVGGRYRADQHQNRGTPHE